MEGRNQGGALQALLCCQQPQQWLLEQTSPPLSGGVRGWSWEAGSEYRWVAGTAVQGTEHICLGESGGAPPHNLHTQSPGSLMGFGSQIGEMIEKASLKVEAGARGC